MKKRIFILLVSLFVCFLPIINAGSHSGDTDRFGGHKDHWTGEYHYHHGYSAHAHPNGVCPYYSTRAATRVDIDDSAQKAEQAKNTPFWARSFHVLWFEIDMLEILVIIGIGLIFLILGFVDILIQKIKERRIRMDALYESGQKQKKSFCGLFLFFCILSFAFATVIVYGYISHRNITETLQEQNGTLQKTIDSLQQKEKELTEKNITISAELDSLKTEYEKLKTDNERANAVKRSSFTLTAGHYSVPEDIAPGKYEITRAGDSGDFRVYDGNGYSKFSFYFLSTLQRNKYSCTIDMYDTIECDTELNFKLIE